MQRNTLIPVAILLLLGSIRLEGGTMPHASPGGGAQPFPDAPDTVPGAVVLASQDEVRFVFPPEESGEWSLPREPCFNGTRAHSWRVSIPDARVGSRFVVLHFDRAGGADCPAHPFPGLEAVVEAARSGIGRPGMFMVFDSVPVEAGVEEGRVVLTIRDRQAIVDLFGLRPAEVGAWTRRAGEDQVNGTVPVTYVDPQIPEPDEAFLQESRALRWEWEVSFRRLGRMLTAGFDGPAVSTLELVVGDSVGPEVHERYCTHDFCRQRFLEVPQAGWSVDDPEVVRLSFREPPDLVAIAVDGALPSSGVRLHAVSPGRTILRLTGMTSAWDTIPSRPPMPQSMEVEVVVTARDPASSSPLPAPAGGGHRDPRP